MGASSAVRCARSWCVRPVCGRSSTRQNVLVRVQRAEVGERGHTVGRGARAPASGARGILRQRQVHRARRRQPRPRGGHVALARAAFAELLRQRGGGWRILAEHRHSGRLPVQPVHQPRGPLQPGAHHVHQAVSDAPLRGLRGDARGLVHRDERLVLEQHAQGGRRRAAPRAGCGLPLPAPPLPPGPARRRASAVPAAAAREVHRSRLPPVARASSTGMPSSVATASATERPT